MILQINDLCKTFRTAASIEPIEVLKNLNLAMSAGDSLAILGQSGSGKSTLLTLLAGLDSPTSGSIVLNDQNMDDLDEESLSKFRAKNIGIIFQQFHLMSHLSALENVSLPLDLFKDSQASEKASEALDFEMVREFTIRVRVSSKSLFDEQDATEIKRAINKKL